MLTLALGALAAVALGALAAVAAWVAYNVEDTYRDYR